MQHLKVYVIKQVTTNTFAEDTNPVMAERKCRTLLMGNRMKGTKTGLCVRSHLENACSISGMVERRCLSRKHLFW